MVDKMMRLAGRGEDGTAKAVALTNDGIIKAHIMGGDIEEFSPLNTNVINKKTPKGFLSFTKIINTTNTAAYTVGADGALYVCRERIQKIPDVTDGSVIETSSIIWSADGRSTPKDIEVFSDGTVVVITTNQFCRLTTWNASPTIIKQTTSNFQPMGVNVHSDGLNKYILVGEYLQSPEVKNLWLSLDGGLTYTSIKQTKTNGVDNSHWHCALYDPYMGRIWASRGDGVSNRGIDFSDDLGVTWESLDGVWQPTLLMALPNMIVTGPDLDGVPAGARRISRPKGELDYQITNDSLKEAFSFRVNDRHSGDYYPEAPFVAEGNVGYIVFPPRNSVENTYIFATGDGGYSWHCVYAGKEKLASIVGITSTGHVVVKKYSGELAYAKAVEWE